MKKLTTIGIVVFLLFMVNDIYAQKYTYKGRVTDAVTGEPLIGVNITVKDNVHGTVTGYDGRFEYTCSFAPPVVFHISYIGYEKQDITVSNADEFIDIKLIELNILGQEVVVSASRIQENIREAPVTIEKLNSKDIQQMSSTNYYDGLYQLKGVDMNVHGLMFQLPNTRGFNSYTNYRMIQIIDGVENISPGMSFAPGNLAGLSQSDIESVELIVGASSALYGPGGMNGTLIMKSKDPFNYQGLTITAQTGLMHFNSTVLDDPKPMGDFSLRYAKAITDKLAIKFNASYLRATDWFANDLRDRSNLDDPSLTRETNPGYDGVNVYGDEKLTSFNLKDVGPLVVAGIAERQGIQPGTPEYEAIEQQVLPLYPDQVVTRTGWAEHELTDNTTENLRIGGTVKYFINDKTDITASGQYTASSVVYSAVNRFALRDVHRGAGSIEIKNPNYVFRIWGKGGNSGHSYDLGATALLMNEAWKGTREWITDYITAYSYAVLANPDMTNAHKTARMVADNRTASGNVLDPTKPAFPLPGTEEFNTLHDDITGKTLDHGGSQVWDNSSVYQAEGMYNFQNIINFMDLQVGASYRFYNIVSDGTVFIDEPGDPLTIYQVGGYTQIIKNFANDHLRGTGTFRFDKDQNFDAQYTPRFSLIYFVDHEKKHSIRGTFQTAYRFPSLSDQFVDIPTGMYRIIGGQEKVRNMYNFNTTYLFPMSGSNPYKDKPVLDDGPMELPSLDVEKVASTELGYKGLLLNKKLFIDAYIYYNRYKGFEASQLLAQYDTPNPDENDSYTVYQTYFSTDNNVTSMGWALSIDYLFRNGILLKANVANNQLLDGIDDPGVEANYNTPEYRTNISIGHNRIIKNLGFNVNFHWQSSFTWEGSFGTAEIPAYATIDAHATYKFPSINTSIKLGASNLTNHYYTTSFGSSQIGGLYYVTLIYDDVLGYISRKKKQQQ
ncbi:MAG: TonB-dependent receptor plug domain-containing protein [Chlorobi bacterium]|nr:TonB-dependent receptor plug domain-containing protein [Chlorobiota bacterium]